MSFQIPEPVATEVFQRCEIISGSFESFDVLIKKISSMLAVCSTVPFVEMMVSVIWEDL